MLPPPASLRWLFLVATLAGCTSQSRIISSSDDDAACVDCIDASRADSQGTDALVPDAPVPDTFVPDAPVPDAPVPDALAPDALVPDALVPDAPVPDSSVTDSSVTDALVPDAFVPDTFVPDAIVPDASGAFATCPGTVVEVPPQTEHTDLGPAMQQAFADAPEGGCVLLPAGQYFVDGSVYVNRRVSLFGQGHSAGGTLLYRREDVSDSVLEGWSSLIRYDLALDTPSNVVVADLALRSKTPAPWDGGDGSLARDIGLFISGIDFVVTRCRFEHFGKGGVQVRHGDLVARGLIFDCEFVHNMKGPNAQGLGYGVVVYGENLEWGADPQLGSDNFLFVEDNYFFEHRHSIAAGGAARYVFRHNLAVDNLISHAVDAHEARGPGNGSNTMSTRVIEVYDNDLVNETDGRSLNQYYNEKAVCLRGGEGVVWGNRIEGYRFGVAATASAFDSTDYPIWTQVGYASGLALGEEHSGADLPYGDGDLFAWDNQHDTVFTWSSPAPYYNYAPDYLAEGRDYHWDVAKPGYVPYPYPHPRRLTGQ